MKKILLIALSLSFFFTGISTNSVKAEVPNDKISTIEKEVIDLTEEIEGFDITDSDAVPEGAPTLNFDSIEEFEVFLKQIEKNQEIIDTEHAKFTIEKNIQDNNLSIMSTTYNDVHTIKFPAVDKLKDFGKIWRPKYMNITIEYSYDHHKDSRAPQSKQFKKIKQVKSFSSDILLGWTQTGNSTNISKNKKSVTIKINGYHTIGVNIKGFSLGAKVNDSYTKTYTLPGVPAKKYR